MSPPSKAALSGTKGISTEETIKSVPELLETDGGKYWITRTSRQAMLFPFNGGDPVVKGEGKKLILPDSPFIPEGSGTVKVKCYDGKERSLSIIGTENK